MKLKQLATAILSIATVSTAFAQLASTVNYNAATPAAPLGGRNIHWQHDSGSPTVNASAYVTYPTLQVACPSSGDLSAPVNAVLSLLTPTSGGIIDARACTAATSWTTAITLNYPDVVILLPCATLVATATFTVTAGTRNTVIHGCGYQGGTTSSGTSGGTVWYFQGSGNAFNIGDPTYAVDTKGFLADNMNINTASATSTANAFYFYRTQEIRLDNLYLNGDGGAHQIGITLDGTGDYTGGTFIDIVTSQYSMAWILTGHRTGGATGDYANASTFIKPHINCPMSGGYPVSGSYGFNLLAADGNTFVGGDVEGCDTVMQFGVDAINNTVTGLRIENSNMQYYAQWGSAFNSVVTGGTFTTGQLYDAGSRNNFSDAFHRSNNGMQGDWYASQQDATVTDHQRLGTAQGNERGRLTEIETDYGYRWLSGYSDATSGEQYYQIQDLLNNVQRLSIGQMNHGQSSTNNQTVLNSAGSGAIVLNGSNNSGTGGVVIGSGGSTSTQVAGFDGNGNESLLGQLNFYAGSVETWEIEGNNATALTIYNANASPGARLLKASTNGDVDFDSQGSSSVTINNTSTGGTGGFTVYEGGAKYAVSAFNVTGSGTASTASNFQAGSSSGTGNLAAGNHLNQIATADYGGTCAMSGASTCTVSLQHSYSVTPLCFSQAVANNVIGSYCTVTSNNAAVTASVANNLTWQVLVIGNPN
jgi:hypothetical protein